MGRLLVWELLSHVSMKTILRFYISRLFYYFIAFGHSGEPYDHCWRIGQVSMLALQGIPNSQFFPHAPSCFMTFIEYFIWSKHFELDLYWFPLAAEVSPFYAVSRVNLDQALAPAVRAECPTDSAVSTTLILASGSGSCFWLLELDCCLWVMLLAIRVIGLATLSLLGILGLLVLCDVRACLRFLRLHH